MSKETELNARLDHGVPLTVVDGIEVADTDAADATMAEAKARIEALEAANAALMNERSNLIETKRQQLAALVAERDEARNNAWPFGKRPNPVAGHTSGDFAVYGDEKSIKRVTAALHELDAMMPARIERIHQEMTARQAAEARCKRLEEALEVGTFTPWLREWCKARFGKWITHNTAKGALADLRSRIQENTNGG